MRMNAKRERRERGRGKKVERMEEEGTVFLFFLFLVFFLSFPDSLSSFNPSSACRDARGETRGRRKFGQGVH